MNNNSSRHKQNISLNYIYVLFICFVTFIITIVSIEILFFIFPSLIPQNILLKMPLWRIVEVMGNDPTKTIVKFNENPWIKFRANVRINDYLRTGEVSSFVSSRQTDSLGFKNLPGIAQQGRADVVILGGSHVEGLGVQDRDTIAGVLNTDYSIKAYSLGVQGYGPQQYLGVLKKFGIAFEPRYVFFSSLAFEKTLQLQEGKLSGRMLTSMVAEEKKVEQSRKKADAQPILTRILDSTFLVAGFRLIRDLTSGGDIQKLKDVSSVGRNPDITTLSELKRFAADRWGRYLDTKFFDFANTNTRDKLERTMKIYEAILLDGKRIGKKNGFLFVVLMLPAEHIMVQVAFPNDLASRSKNTYVQYQAWFRERILQFCMSNSIPVVDTTRGISENLQRNFIHVPQSRKIDLNDLPFFKMDGHPTAVAHAIYAKSIKNFIDQQSSYDK